MTDVEIDALSGGALARAVAEANHAVETKDTMRFRYWVWPGGRRVLFNKYRPDCHIDQAFELSNDGWGWEFKQWCDPPSVEVFVWTAEGDASAFVTITDHHSRSAAYATAICRAYLKARGKE